MRVTIPKALAEPDNILTALPIDLQSKEAHGKAATGGFLNRDSIATLHDTVRNAARLRILLIKSINRLHLQSRLYPGRRENRLRGIACHSRLHALTNTGGEYLVRRFIERARLGKLLYSNPLKK